MLTMLPVAFCMTHPAKFAVIILPASITAFLLVTAVPDFSRGQFGEAGSILASHVMEVNVWLIKLIEISVEAVD